MQFSLNFPLLIISFFVIFPQTNLWSQDEIIAELLTPDDEFCESGQISIQIKFSESYSPPFKTTLRINNSKGERVDEWTNEEFYPSENEGSYTYIKTKALDYDYDTYTLTIVEVIDGDNNTYSEDIIKGSTSITISKTPSSYSAGDDIIKCGLSAELGATGGPESNIYNWETVEAASFNDTTITNPIFSAEKKGLYVLTFTQTNGACKVSDNINVTLLGYPSASISTESKICGSGNATIDFDFTGDAPFTVDYSYGDNSSQFTSSDASTSLTHTLTQETTFKLLTVTDANGCITSFTDESGTSAIVKDLLPIANAGEDREICDTKITLSAAVPSIGKGSWSGGGSFTDINSNTSIFEPDTFEGQITKTLTWTVNNNGCTAIDKVNITFYKQLEDEFISAGKDTLIYQQNTLKLNATPPPFGKGIWTITDGKGDITDINNPNADIINLEYGTTRLLWTVSNGICPAKWDETEIKVQGLENPTGFSPNGDNKNEFFKILGAENIENNKLIIFNQQGEVVYKVNNYQNNWNGSKENGEMLPDGYYYYVFTGKGVKIRDYLIIKRSIR